MYTVKFIPTKRPTTTTTTTSATTTTKSPCQVLEEKIYLYSNALKIINEKFDNSSRVSVSFYTTFN